MSSSPTAKSIFFCIDLVRDEVFQRPVMMNRSSVLNRGGADDSRTEKNEGLGLGFGVSDTVICNSRGDIVWEMLIAV